MKITILNESYFNETHLAQLRELGELTIYENTNSEEKAIERLKNIDIAIGDCYIAPFNKKVFESTNTLKLLALNTTGYDLVDIDSAHRCGVEVANVPGFSTQSVAEQSFALMLAVSRKIPIGDVVMRVSPFQIDPGLHSHKQYLGVNLAGKTLGIIGLGSIGSRVAQIGRGFGMKVIAYNRSQKNVDEVTMVTLDQLLKESDIISIHLPLTPETENLITADKLGLMKTTAIIINTARGKIIDEAALINALIDGRIAGAGLDTIVNWEKTNPLLELDNVVFSPHSAFFTKESLENCANIIVENIKSFVAGRPLNIIS